ncbi:MAG: glycosyltransferase [Mesorhizobium sp.]|uniref:glycoside hydrolase family 99-like domain-containing protein n=3 Tax=Mesorhizobium TaxID=68287 RepID=UPI000F764E3B|nr:MULTISPECIES: glycoside hydrolase family 99-like domain-containing protein [unclassified Mesorhizobium]RVC70163.1 glycosyltransferase [Mesorhizobium sp. M00.F.Ca.ET.038.03.1.1]RVC81836.1 glycosyltransferase [Mesorhizobium sp. M2A.F.Ca.ET.046.02.1.1]AZO33533.1 glycosyltransferase [Mesorhizobium sp. M2A.F.Ca.ET.046.03.2.1]RWA89187.1 MAG: glycosyltransferase [Mesorhizobium sp.]RWB42746.1 MAG: glycosyltransferase [Mesorhizobium sp.]
MNENPSPEQLRDATAQPADQAAPKKRAKARSAKTKPAKRICVMVLGMHRSGTSALTRVISLVGAELPKNLISKDSNNATGYWEPAALNALNDQMLAEAGSRWDDWRAFDAANLGKPRAQFYRAEIARILEEEYGEAPLFVLKEPRISRFVPFYADILKAMEIDVRYVLTGRNPLSVIASLGKRDGFTPGFGALLWLRHELEAESATRGKPRVFLSYEALMQDWRPEIRNIADVLAIGQPWTVDDIAAHVDAYLSREHQHHIAGGAQLLADERIADWVKDTHAALTALRNDGQDAEALATLDRVKAEFDAVSPIFGDAFFPELEARQRISAQAQADLRMVANDSAELARQRADEIETLTALERQRQADWGEREAQFAGEKAELHRLIGERDAEVTRLVPEAEQSMAEIERLGEETAHRLELQEYQTAFAKELAGLKSLADQRALQIEQLQNQASQAATIQSHLQAEHDRLRWQAHESTARYEELERENAALRANATGLEMDRDHARAEEKRLHDVLDAVYGSTSWRTTQPVRAIGYGIAAVARIPVSGRKRLSRAAYASWHRLPMPTAAKQKFKGAVFRFFPFLFKRTTAYRAWRSSNSYDGGLAAIASTAPVGLGAPKPTHVPLLNAEPVANKPVRVIAFYLPQFHPIPENDEWWGQGFTEWVNVKPAQPQFLGHCQPHVPGELGYYDLRDKAVQRRQIELAKLYGIEGFCFYFYWFAGKRLLEKPLENWLNDRDLDLPFCLCWANENWSRRWDGLDSEILIAQNHSPADDLAFIKEVAPYLRDPRYIRIDGKPVLLVYRPSLLPDASETASRWRQWCRDNGVGEIYLAYTQSFEKNDPRHYGFDAAVEFPPNNSAPPNVTGQVVGLRDDFATTVYDWAVFPERSEAYPPREYKLLRSVCPGWDNTARRKNNGTAFINNTPDLYKRWLENAAKDTINCIDEPSERLVFVNAWNEWAEGAHLEPDAQTGYAYLQATRDALEAVGREGKSIVVVSHDAHPHGAQMLAMNMARGFGELGFKSELITLGHGNLLPRFAEVANVHIIDLAAEPEAKVLERLKAIRRGGAEMAVVNTTVSGLLVPLLRRAGFCTVSLIHELPGILKSHGLERNAAAIAKHADVLVFPAEIVRSGFENFVGRSTGRAVTRPQGSYFRTPFREEDRVAVRDRVRKRLGLREDARIILSVGYGDHRKGLDLFVDAGLKITRAHPDAAAVWVGHVDHALQAFQMQRIKDARLEDRFVFIGLVEDPRDYYFSADIYVLTSREDPFPSVVLEALDAAVPVVAFEGAGGFQDLLKRDCGILVPKFDTDAMARAVCSLLDNSEEAEHLAKIGREIVRQEFGFSHYLHDLLAYAGRPLPRVSVVVPNYNYDRYLIERLNSIVRQTVRPYELIVLDDASTDDSVKTIEQFLATCDIPAKLVRNERNSGSVFRQWMRGVEAARGDFVWIAEADDLADPDLLEKLLPAFERRDVVMSYCQSRQMDGDGRILSEDYLDYVSDIDRSRWAKPYVVDGRQEIAEALYLKNTIPNVSAVLFRRAPLIEVLQGELEEIASYRDAGDWVAYLRLLEKGGVAFDPRPLNSHRRHQSSVTRFDGRHLQEIAKVQAETIARFHLGASAQAAAAAYVQSLYEQFGLRALK